MQFFFQTSIHHDENIYPDAQVFNPSRFMSENKKHLKNNYWFPFSQGELSFEKLFLTFVSF